VTDTEWRDAHRINTLVDAHRDDPEFGYRFLADMAAEAGQTMAERTAWRLCSQNGMWSTVTKKGRRGKGRVGPPVHDDHVARDFSASAPNELWLTDITEHPTSEGKLYLCAVRDQFAGRIVGYSMASRMEASIAVHALNNAVLTRGAVSGCVLHSDRGSQFRS
jgi:transposase InsO family protein